jgi:hypothetical protein
MDWSKLPSAAAQIAGAVASPFISPTQFISLETKGRSTEMKGQMKGQSSEMKGRSSEEIVARLKQFGSPPALSQPPSEWGVQLVRFDRSGPAGFIDLFGVRKDKLLRHLDFKTASQWLGDSSNLYATDWEKLRKPTDGASLLAAMRDYMEFAWDKAVNHRRLSCIRSIDHFCEWIWLLGSYEEAFWSEIVMIRDRDCGQPALALICKRYNFPIHPRCRWRIDDNGSFVSTGDIDPNDDESVVVDDS